MAHIHNKRGHNLHISGVPSRVMSEINIPKIIKLHPTDFPSIKPKLIINEGDKVKAGTPVYTDKNMPEVMFTSPVSGVLGKVVYGIRRVIESIEIITSHHQEKLNFKSVELEGIQSLDKIDIQNTLLTAGYWPSIRSRPFSKIAKPNIKPKSIFINAATSSPFAADDDYIFNISSNGFQAGVDILKKLTDCNIHLVIKHKSQSKILKNIKNVLLHTCSGPHPSGNTGFHIHKIDPIKDRNDIVWYVSPQDVRAIGLLFLKGEPYYKKIITIGGSIFKERQYYKIFRGTPISDILNNNVLDNNSRLISGDILSGHKTNYNNALGYYHEILSGIPEGTDRNFLGWIMPGLKKYSLSRTFLFPYFKSKKKILTSNKNGSLRTIIPIGNCEKVMPLDILVIPLIKAILAHDIETMEKLGIYECAPEDFSLSTFADASKMNFSNIIQEGLDLIEAEG